LTVRWNRDNNVTKISGANTGMGLHPENNLHEAVRELAETPPQANLFEDAYKHCALAKNAVVTTVEHHPLIATGGVVAGAVVLFCLTRGESAIAAGGAITKTGEEILLPKAATEKMAAQTGEREAVLKQVGPIPDVERPMLNGAAKNAIPEHFAKAASDYQGSLAKLKQLSLTHTAGAGQDMAAMAKEILEGRVPVTGERISPESLADEVKRLYTRNPELEVKEGSTVIVYAENDLTKLAEKTQFKHVPQLGQLLKENGVTEEQIGKALNIQKAEPQASKRLIGQILTDEGLATKDQVDAAFAKQGQLKGILANVRKEAGF
jgi:hypothetical protein